VAASRWRTGAGEGMVGEGTKDRMIRRRERGFSLLEMMTVLAILLIAGAMAVMAMQPMLQNSRVANSYNTTMAAMRQAREWAVAQRQVYIVNFAAPGTITITQGATGRVLYTFTLPSDVSFTQVAGIPGGANAPDGFSLGGAIAFDQNVAGGNANAIYFMPDGSAQDALGNVNNGVIYIARPNQLYSSRAVTVWGLTGRLRGWRLYNNGGTAYWRQT
jgi:prepilin-type N-terminal cleavage/methylation domain-containing protein